MRDRVRVCAYAVSVMSFAAWAVHMYMDRPRYELGALAACWCATGVVGCVLTFVKVTQ